MKAGGTMRLAEDRHVSRRRAEGCATHRGLRPCTVRSSLLASPASAPLAASGAAEGAEKSPPIWKWLDPPRPSAWIGSSDRFSLLRELVGLPKKEGTSGEVFTRQG